MSTAATRSEYLLVGIDGAIGTITLNRPDKLNAFVDSMREELAGVVTELAQSDDVRVIVITGAGRAFCAGADIDYMRQLIEEGNVAAFESLVEAGRDVVTAIRKAPKPVIASMNGPAAGGGANLALACDLRIASDRASLGQTFNSIGLHPDWGGTFFLPRLVGYSRAIEMIFKGEMIDAFEANRMGIINEVVPHDQLPKATRKLAMFLAKKPPIALALSKQAIYQSFESTLDEMLDIELQNQLTCFQSEDVREGFQAFVEKRQPNFKGK
ncbi:MAG: enoyl-CoA hydratase [Gemmatimonadetes bacterium]|nr:enoyl-CoA hydratase [Gemmatimonadota bacterium]